ncbi:MAG: carbonic anhydrase [Chlamydiota bacterium]
MHYLCFIFFLITTMNALAHQPQAALNRLIDGNKRYVTDRLKHPNRTSESRKAVAQQQKPFAAILSCADSRVAPEIVFDQGIGDLFVVRIAGNVAGSLELESLQFAVENLGSIVVVVLGHKNCGAVHAVVNGQIKDIPKIAHLIDPAIKGVKKGQPDTLDRAVQANVEHVVNQLKQAPFLAPLLKGNGVALVGGVYHLETGKVDFL